MASFEVQLTVYTVLTVSVLFSGIVFGWAPLQLILSEEGQFKELCPPGHKGDGICTAQQNIYSVIFTAAMFFVSFSSLTNGLFLDKVRPMWTFLTAGLLQIAGLVLFGFSDSKTFHYFTESYCLLAVAGQMTLVAAYTASFLIPERQNGILAGVSCLFDASSIVFLIFLKLFQVVHISRQTLFLGYAVLAAIFYLATVILWKRNLYLLSYDEPEEQESLAEGATTNYGTGSAPADKDAEFRTLGVKEQVFSVHFAFYVVFTALNIFRANTYIGVQNQLMLQYGDAETGFFYTELFGAILPLGALFIPAVERSLDNGGVIASLHITNVLGIIYNALEFVPILWVQSLANFVFTGYRAFLYSVLTAFVAQIFGLAHMGTIVGAGFFIGAAINLLQAPAVAYVNGHLNGDLTYLNATLLGLALLVSVLIEAYRIVLKRAEVSEEVIQESVYMPMPTSRRMSVALDFQSPRKVFTPKPVV